jgi:hypothetical protein
MLEANRKSPRNSQVLAQNPGQQNGEITATMSKSRTGHGNVEMGPKLGDTMSIWVSRTKNKQQTSAPLNYTTSKFTDERCIKSRNPAYNSE